MKKKEQKRNNGKNNNILTCMFIAIISFSFMLVVCHVYGDETKNNEPRVSYHDLGKTPDPFKPIIEPVVKKTKTTTAKKERSVPLTPLELFSIDQLRLVGITMGQGKNMAMIEDPTGKFYLITKGTLIGLKQGKVTDIHPDRVVVEEKTLGAGEKERVNRIVLELFSETSGE
jgi:Tfp pilus assembly protein PilP